RSWHGNGWQPLGIVAPILPWIKAHDVATGTGRGWLQFNQAARSIREPSSIGGRAWRFIVVSQSSPRQQSTDSARSPIARPRSHGRNTIVNAILKLYDKVIQADPHVW